MLCLLKFTVRMLSLFKLTAQIVFQLKSHVFISTLTSTNCFYRKIHETIVPFSSKAPTLKLYSAIRSNIGIIFVFPYGHANLTFSKSQSCFSALSSMPHLGLKIQTKNNNPH